MGEPRGIMKNVDLSFRFFNELQGCSRLGDERRRRAHHTDHSNFPQSLRVTVDAQAWR